ncbi:MAG: hypothetical protein ACXABY_01240 [Candidatus Thorarchaeota archaeon]|jgi:hypothetical protein
MRDCEEVNIRLLTSIDIQGVKHDPGEVLLARRDGDEVVGLILTAATMAAKSEVRLAGIDF